MPSDMYTSGDYLKKNPSWHSEDSPWKAGQIIKMLKRNGLKPRTICEVGCGAGDILKTLHEKMGNECRFFGYEVSAQAFEICSKKTNEKLTFKLKDILEEKDVYFDLILLIDLIEHVEDYRGFLKGLKSKSRYKICHIPLDLSAQTILRSKRLLHERESVGHIHYFTKETALQALKDTGYEIIDHFYTASYVDLSAKSIKSRLAKLPRKLFFAVNRDLAVRSIGGYSLMVLAK